jgi:hypothetical protein
MRWLIPKIFGVSRLIELAEQQRDITAFTAIQALLAHPRHLEKGALACFGSKVHSQADEDGIIHEIFRRISAPKRSFIEIGLSDGLECNSRLLLRQGWRGAWIEGSADYAKKIEARFMREIADGALTVQTRFVTAENINETLGSLSVWREELGLFSIDIDGNDYHILKAIEGLRAQVVVLEYNPVWVPPIEWVAAYDPSHRWRGGDDYSASLKAYENLMTEKGYRLVGCSLNGNNAFFVRSDLLGDRFVADCSAERHYEPQRFWLTHGYISGHSR